MRIRTPADILEYTSDVGVVKAHQKIRATLILAFLAGAFIAFAAAGSTMAAYNLFASADTFGLGRAIAGAVFGTGLVMVVLAGAELFTGNMLMIVGVLDRKVKIKRMLINWLLVYAGNFVGSMLIVWMMYASGMFNASDGLVGGMTIKIAAGKTALPFHSALLLGVMCNWLVCLAVWASSAAKDVAGKVLTIFFIIGLFIISGFEHSVANMYYIPAGLLAKSNLHWLDAARSIGVSTAQIDGLSWGTFFGRNLLPVTLGNIIGGSGMVGALYWLSLGKRKKK